MKILFKICVFVLGVFYVFSVVSAQNGRWGTYGSDPLQIFESVVDGANEGGYGIQETSIDGINDMQGAYSQEYKISNTLDYVRKNMDPYLQRIIYVGLVLATIGLIYLGFLLVTHAIHKQGDWKKIKDSIMYIVLGVFLLGGFYFIIKVIVALITSVFGGSTGDSGY